MEKRYLCIEADKDWGCPIRWSSRDGSTYCSYFSNLHLDSKVECVGYAKCPLLKTESEVLDRR